MGSYPEMNCEDFPRSRKPADYIATQITKYFSERWPELFEHLEVIEQMQFETRLWVAAGFLGG